MAAGSRDGHGRVPGRTPHAERGIAAFDRVAGQYDAMAALNPGYHTQLRRAARRLALPGRGAGLRVLDLGCGTGASTAALLAAAPQVSITAVDGSAGMLRRAVAKQWPDRVAFVQATAESLAQGAVPGPFDAVFAAYLVRDVADPDTLLRTTRALLRPGGRLAVHEYTLSGQRTPRAVWSAVCRGIVIPVGRLTGDGACLYRQLWRSVLDFDTAQGFRLRLIAAGFAGVHSAPASGWQRGIVHTFLADRPPGAAG